MSNRTGIMLCYPFEESRLSKWPIPYIIQPKLDGDRCRAIIDEHGRVTLLSSEENRVTSAPHIIEQLEDMNLRNIELDGELFSNSLNHQAIHGIVGRTVNLHPDFETLEYHIFDIINEETQARRCQTLRDTIQETDNVKVVQTEVADTFDEVMSWLDKYTEQGQEGIIVRHLLAPYVRKRSTLMMKFKPRKEDYYIIDGFEEEIDKYGQPKDSLGALWLKSNDVNERFKVGSGSFLTREARADLWAVRESLRGKVAHVKYQHLTDRQVPRFPVLVDVINPTFKF
jgi:ATP-dependent DNA ligase